MSRRAAIRAQHILGLPIDYIRLSLRDESDAWLGSREQWEQAQEALHRVGAPVAAEHGLDLVEVNGEAAFYGPKFDLQVRDGRGHEETIATVQLDFNQPERFDLTYTGPDSRAHRVVMIHRGTVGSMERVTAALLERYQGRLPFWLAPTQMVVLPVSSEQDAAARELVDHARARGLRAWADHDGGLGARIRDARARRDHLIAVIGPTEVDTGQVQITDVANNFRGHLDRQSLLDDMARAHEQRLGRVAGQELMRGQGVADDARSGDPFGGPAVCRDRARVPQVLPTARDRLRTLLEPGGRSADFSGSQAGPATIN